MSGSWGRDGGECRSRQETCVLVAIMVGGEGVLAVDVKRAKILHELWLLLSGVPAACRFHMPVRICSAIKLRSFRNSRVKSK